MWTVLQQRRFGFVSARQALAEPTHCTRSLPIAFALLGPQPFR
jgi:hypothetical protein